MSKSGDLDDTGTWPIDLRVEKEKNRRGERDWRLMEDNRAIGILMMKNHKTNRT